MKCYKDWFVDSGCCEVLANRAVRCLDEGKKVVKKPVTVTHVGQIHIDAVAPVST